MTQLLMRPQEKVVFPEDYVLTNLVDIKTHGIGIQWIVNLTHGGGNKPDHAVPRGEESFFF